MTQFISPGVYVLEKDLSQYVSDLSSTIVAMVGTADKGPTNTPTLITSAAEFTATFGKLNPNHYMGYAALAYLKQGSILYVTRVAASDSAKAKLTVPVPASYTPYAGNWALTSQTANSAVFTVTNAPTTANLTITTPAGPALPIVNWVGGNWKSAGIVAGSRLTFTSFTTAGNNATFVVEAVDAINPALLTLVSGSTVTAEVGVGVTFISSDNELVALQDASFKLPGFDFTDTTGVATIKTKLGSDLYSYGLNTSLVEQYVKGREFKITSGVGKDSFATITDMARVDTSTMDITVDPKKFNVFNSPLLTTATGSLLFKTGVVPSSNAVLATIGSTSTGGTIDLIFNEPVSLTTSGAKDTLVTTLNAGGSGAVTALDGLVLLSGINVTIKVPLYYTTTVIAGEDAKNAALVTAIISAIITAFRSGSVGSGALLTASAVMKAVSNGITGIGSVDPITGVSAGVKSAVVQADGVTVALSAIVVGAYGNLDPEAIGTVVTSTPIQISGSFSTDLYRPTWVVSTAGSSKVPTLFKFTSIGEADLSNIAVTVGINNITKVDKFGNLLYNVSLFSRVSSNTVPSTSTLQSDFLLLESFEGTPEVLQSTINANSSYINLKLDYATDDTIDYHTGLSTYGTYPDYLTSSFGLVGDLSGLGAVSGYQSTVVSGTLILPVYSNFLLGGSLGSVISKSDILGESSAKTGVYSFADPEQIDINLLVAPGWSADPTVAKGMVALCEKRSDCMAILDTPFGLSVQNVINYKNNVLNINSNYAAIYYPWVKITDTTNSKDIFVPPSGLVAGQYAYSDLVGEVFSAPAGRNRGNLTEALATERILNQGDRDLLTLAHINPIHFEAGYGIYIRGQMTMQSATTALDRVNVRRLLLNLRKVIATASKSFEFEPGDSITALRLKQLAESTLENRLRKGAIRSYIVDVGPTVNTASTLENNELRMEISIVPTKTAEKIIEVFNILGQGQGISLGA
jgi:phage tail sheath protein FI